MTELTGQAKNLIQFAFYSGLRTSELIALHWQDVELEQNRIFVKQAHVCGQLKETKTKSGKREVALQPQAKEALLNQLNLPESSMKPFFTIHALTNPGKTISQSARMFGHRH